MGGLSPPEPPAAANIEEVCAVMRVNLTNLPTKVQVKKNYCFGEGGGGGNDFKTKYSPLLIYITYLNSRQNNCIAI